MLSVGLRKSLPLLLHPKVTQFPVCFFPSQEERWKLEEKARELTSGSGMSTETAQEAAGPVPEEVDDDEDEMSLHTEQTVRFGLSEILTPDDLDDQDYLATIKDKLVVWDKTILGKEYREIRLNKRQRQQPALITDMPFLYGEKLGRPSYGPYYSVAISPIIKRPDLVHPDFMSHPEKYFTNREDFTGSSALLVHSKLPLVEQCEWFPVVLFVVCDYQT
ncbi:unnamed protein product [Dibothriocephalus latus]|uniref:Uncharacterized protein n=1 Tax=Dibothriocephalus latus TaxID=60516 RepID=A0A3P7MG01_DIBLA|nr:unnamed protein product [Dibothriocephalus latus]